MHPILLNKNKLRCLRNKNGEINLKPITRADLPMLFDWINNPDLVKLNSPFKRVSKKEHLAWYNSIIARTDVVLFGIWKCCDNTLIGTCQLTGIDNCSRKAELRIRIGIESERGKGYGSEAIHLLIHFGFFHLNLNRVYLETLATNKIAIKAYKKCGFIEEGVARKSAFIDRKFIDGVLMGILRQDFVRKR